MSKQLIQDDNGVLIEHKERPSAKWRAMRLVEPWEFQGHKMERWENHIYYAAVERFVEGFGIGGGPYIRIGITALNETARHDWREFQWIKNDIAGPEWEAVELYPAESRLLDPSNRFYLFCVPKGVLPIGMFSGRSVLNHKYSIAPQRPFCGGKKDWTPNQ